MKYPIRYLNNINILKGGGRFEDLPDNTILNLKGNIGDSILHITKGELLKFPDSFLTTAVKYGVDGFMIKLDPSIPISDLIINIELFSYDELNEIIFFYKNNYWNLNPYLYSGSRKIPKLDGETIDFDNLLMFLGLPSDSKTLYDYPEEEEYDDDDDDYDDETKGHESKFTVPNTLKSHHAKMEEHHFKNPIEDWDFPDSLEGYHDYYGDQF
jgi:hypothetical protein